MPAGCPFFGDYRSPAATSRVARVGGREYSCSRQPYVEHHPAPRPGTVLYERSYGDAVGHLFLVSLPFAILALVCVLFIEEVPLRTTVNTDAEEEAGLP